MNTKSLIFLFLLLLICVQAKSQEAVFTKVTYPEGVNLGGINKITQDKDGFMWLASINGLHRYDGYHLISYYHDPNNQNTIASDNITYVLVSKTGALWIGTKDKGLDKFDPLTKTFTHYQHIPQDPTSLSHNKVNTILEDKNGTVWVGTQGGLNRLNKASGTFYRYLHQPGNSSSLSNDVVSTLYQDKRGTLWVGTTGNLLSYYSEGGLNQFNPRQGTFIRYVYKENDPASLLNNKVRAIFEDSRNVLWIGTSGDGLHSLNREKGIFTRHPYTSEQPDKLSRAPLISNNILDGVTFIHEDVKGILWIGTYGSGVSSYNNADKKVKHFVASNKDLHGLQNNYFSCAYTSKEGVLWLGTMHGGQLYRTDPLRLGITYLNTNAAVRALLKDASGTIWAGTKVGLKIFEQNKESIRPKKVGFSLPADLVNVQVWSILEDRHGAIWLGGEKGLWWFNPKNGAYKQYTHNPQVPDGIGPGIVTRLLEDAEGAIWVGKDQSGLARLDINTGVFTHFQFKEGDTTSLRNDFVSALFQDSKGILWVGNWSGFGLNKFNKKTGGFTHFLSNGKTISAIQEDASGRMYIGTSEQGLYVYDPGKKDFVKFKDKRTGNFIPYSVKGMALDNQGNLWVHTTEGLTKIDRNANLIATYGAELGLIPGEFTLLASHKSKEGRIYLGDINGFYTFIPQEKSGNKFPPQIQLTDFRLLEGLNNHTGKDLTIPQIQNIRLQHNQNNFAFDFAGIHYANPNLNSHFYLLENYDTFWREAKSEPTASYFKVPSGNYVLRLKAMSSEGIWAEKKFDVVILLPWWQTWWAYGLYGIFFIGSLWGFIHYRSGKLKHDKQVLEQKVVSRTAEVMQQKEEIATQRDNLENTLQTLKQTQVQLIQQEKLASLGELTAGIAHEIQNPLNFVNNFSEVSAELLQELKEGPLQNLPETDKQYAHEIISDLDQNLHKILVHGKRADSIVKGMLQHSRASTGQKELINLNALTEEYLRLSYHGLRAKDKSFNATIQTHYDPDIDKVLIIPQDIGRVFLNLFNNAFYSINQKKKRVNGAYAPKVEVSTKKWPGKVEICIRDNGPGISPEVRDKIFQPFFTTKPPGQGTGLGLSISYDIITKGHGGEIKLDTQEGEYAEFLIYLPIGENHT